MAGFETEFSTTKGLDSKDVDSTGPCNEVDPSVTGSSSTCCGTALLSSETGVGTWISGSNDASSDSIADVTVPEASNKVGAATCQWGVRSCSKAG